MKIKKQDILCIMAIFIYAPSQNQFNNVQQTINNYGTMTLNNCDNFQNNANIQADAKTDTKVSNKKSGHNVKPSKKNKTQRHTV